MAYSRDEALALLDLSEGSESELIKKFRGLLSDRLEPSGSPEPATTLEGDDAAELAAFRREKLFTEAGVPDTKEGRLLRRALANEENLNVEKIQAEFAEFAEGGGSPVTETEAAAIEAFAASAGEAPATPPDIVERMEKASSLAELEALEREAGLTVVGGTLQTYGEAPPA